MVVEVQHLQVDMMILYLSFSCTTTHLSTFVVAAILNAISTIAISKPAAVKSFDALYIPGRGSKNGG